MIKRKKLGGNKGRGKSTNLPIRKNEIFENRGESNK